MFQFRSNSGVVRAACFLSLLAHGLAQTPNGKQGFCVHAGGINLPIGKFLLIRKGNQLGALRLVGIAHDTATRPRAGEWIGTVDYESYFVEAGQALDSPAAVKVSDKLEFGRIKGFGFHYSWQSGNMSARVGPWKFTFFDQDGMVMTTSDFWNGSNRDGGFEFAPTGATDLAAINPHDPRLHWYRRDPEVNMPCPVPVPN